MDGTTNFFSPTCWLFGTSCTALPVSQVATIPAGPVRATAAGRLLEAYVSARYLNHAISFGKSDYWLGPGVGGAMAYSNNAENIYSFRIDRTEPLDIPLLSRITGPFRYEFLVGPLRGHVYPRNPWVHVEKISFRPSTKLELGFERTVIWGGKDHEPVNLKTFLRSFFSVTAPGPAIKDSAMDPGARFSAFDFSWRLPFVSNWLTLYTPTTMSRQLTLRGTPAFGRAFIFPMYRGLPSSTCASRAYRPILLPPGAKAALLNTLRRCKDRATPIGGSFSATGLDARARVARVGSPIT